MAKKAKEILNYISGWHFDQDQRIRVNDIHSEKVELSHTKRFHNCLYLLAGLSPCARNLMDWLGEEMNDKNIVYHTEDSRKAFNDFIAMITNDKVRYADQTIKQAWGELSASGLLIKQGSRSAFLVHPKYFFNGEQNKRIERIVAKLIFDNSGIDNFKVLTNKKLGL